MTRLGWQAYRLVRPLVRPALWRLRTFLVGRVHDELTQLRGETAALRAEIAALHEATQQQRGLEAAVVERHMAEVMGAALATLALDRFDPGPAARAGPGDDQVPVGSPFST